MDTLYPRKKLVFKDVSFGHLANIDETFSSTTSNYSFLQAICDSVFHIVRLLRRYYRVVGLIFFVTEYILVPFET